MSEALSHFSHQQEPLEQVPIHRSSINPILLSRSALLRLRVHNLPIADELLGEELPDTPSAETDQLAEVVQIEQYRKRPTTSEDLNKGFYEEDFRKITAAREEPHFFEELCAEYMGFLRFRAANYFLAGGDSEDVLQEAMIGFYKAVRDYDGSKASFKTFADLCVTRQIITAVKTATRFKHTPLNTYESFASRTFRENGDSDLEFGGTLQHQGVAPDEEIIGKEGFWHIFRTLSAGLSSLEYDCLRLFFGGESYQSIADTLAVSTKTVDNALQRTKRKIISVQNDTNFKSPLLNGTHIE